MKKIKGQYRQGDVLIQGAKSFPANAVKQKRAKRIILAQGEATGHHHSLEADKADWWKQDEGGDQYIGVKKATAVTHQEHGPIPLGPTIYRVRRQKEYSPAAIRNVAD